MKKIILHYYTYLINKDDRQDTVKKTSYLHQTNVPKIVSVPTAATTACPQYSKVAYEQNDK